MIYFPFRNFDRWAYIEWLYWKFLFPEIIDIVTSDEDGCKGAKYQDIEAGLDKINVYCANYIRRDYEEAEWIGERIEAMRRNYWPIGSNGRYYIDNIVRMCDKISEMWRPNEN